MSVLQRLAIAFALWLIALAPAGAVERILSFVSDVAVERNGDLDVTETIRVQAEGNQIRHGILRDFPTIYTRNDGTRVEVGFTVQSVTRDGGSENWTLEGLSNGVRVRIGSADATVSNGPHTYVIKYVTTRQIGFFADYDELYWNATGTGWTFPIDQAEARIALPCGRSAQANLLLYRRAGRARPGRDHRRAKARPHCLPHHAGIAGARRSYRCGRMGEGRRRCADRVAKGFVLARGQQRGRSCDPGRADRSRVLRFRLAKGRP